MYDPANGFAPPGTSSSYDPGLHRDYRAAQRRRIKHIDADADDLAAEATEARVRYSATQDARHRRRALAPRIITTYRTDADPRLCRPVYRPERPALRLPIRPPPGSDQLRTCRVRTVHDARRVALHLVGLQFERDLRTVRQGCARCHPLRRIHWRPSGLPSATTTGCSPPSPRRTSVAPPPAACISGNPSTTASRLGMSPLNGR